jgi:hypothetical protein
MHHVNIWENMGSKLHSASQFPAVDHTLWCLLHWLCVWLVFVNNRLMVHVSTFGCGMLEQIRSVHWRLIACVAEIFLPSEGMVVPWPRVPHVVMVMAAAYLPDPRRRAFVAARSPPRCRPWWGPCVRVAISTKNTIWWFSWRLCLKGLERLGGESILMDGDKAMLHYSFLIAVSLA